MRPDLSYVLVGFALLVGWAALRTRDLVTATFILGGYSFLLCLNWTVMGAVDVALTEAAVGAGVSTVLFIAAVHRTRRVAAPARERPPKGWIRVLGLAAVLPVGALLLYGSMHLPPFGDAHSPAATHVAAYYQAHTLADTHVPNAVTTILADYRGYDTMFETTVIFCAGTAVALLVRRPHKKKRAVPGPAAGFSLIRNSPDVVTEAVCRIVVPLVQLYGLYVVAHGHSSPGGGFQGGVSFAATIILLVLAFGWQAAYRRLGEGTIILLSAVGVLLYAGTAALCLAFGGNLLDYSALAPLFHCDARYARYYGMAVVEWGVGFAVMCIMVSLFLDLVTGGRHEQAVDEVGRNRAAEEGA